MSQDIPISFCIEEMNDHNDEFDIDLLINEMDKYEETHKYDFMVPHMINYHENFTVKELLCICEYYGFAKDLKTNKYNKEQIIDFLVTFESDPTNYDIVFKRQNMWFYINELKNDKFMKKFILW